jgi:hypothetical protein
MADQRLRELLIRAELEDCQILEKDESPYLAFCGVVGILAEAEAAAEAGRSSSPAPSRHGAFTTTKSAQSLRSKVPSATRVRARQFHGEERHRTVMGCWVVRDWLSEAVLQPASRVR